MFFMCTYGLYDHTLQLGRRVCQGMAHRFIHTRDNNNIGVLRGESYTMSEGCDVSC